MTGPQDPDEPVAPTGSGDDDWAFPEVSPTSLELPEPEPQAEDVVYDTGSDAWWRAQAKGQRAAAQHDPVVPPRESLVAPILPPPPLVEPPVLRPDPTPPSPLDSGWLPTELDDPPAPDQRWYEPAPAVPDPPAPDVAPEPPLPALEDAPPQSDVPLAEPPPASYADEDPAASYADEDPAEGARAPGDTEKVGPVRAIAGAAIAVAGVCLGIGALLLLGDDEPRSGPTVALPPSATATRQPSSAPTQAPTASAPAAPATPPPVVTTPPAVPPVLPVTVLNNSRISGLADRAAKRFNAGGWPTPVVGNFRGRVGVTTVYFATGQEASARRFAGQFGIARVAPRFEGLPGRGLTVVLTRDYA